MARNSGFLQREQRSFFKVLNSVAISSENMRAIPHDFAKCFSDDELLGTMKIRTQWGRSWELKISKNPRFYFMEKSGWETFVRDNALGNEFMTFTHKGRMHFHVNIMHQSGKEILKPPQTRTSFRASSSHVRKEQDVKTEEVVVSARLSSSGPRTGMYKRKLNFGTKRTETERVVSNKRDSAGPSSFSGARFNVWIRQSYLNRLVIPTSAARKYMPKENTWFKIHRPDGKKSWVVYYVVTSGHIFSRGWSWLCKEYPVVVGDICKFTFVNPHELLLLVSNE